MSTGIYCSGRDDDLFVCTGMADKEKSRKPLLVFTLFEGLSLAIAVTLNSLNSDLSSRKCRSFSTAMSMKSPILYSIFCNCESNR